MQTRKSVMNNKLTLSNADKSVMNNKLTLSNADKKRV